MKFVRDSVHGTLNLTEFELKLIDTPPLQRLRRIRQLGFINLIYPGANHSRFEHSIGALYLASRLADSIGLDEDKKSLLRICALLHDVGHGPFSHVSEPALNVPHEEFTSYVIKNSEITDVLNEKYKINKIDDIIHGKSVLGQAISGELDVDRMDYLLRDSHYTGVAYGTIDVERLIYNLKLENNLVLDIKGVQAAESMLVARYFMYPSVYQHHTTRIVNAMFRRCLKHAITNGLIDSQYLNTHDDSDLLCLCRAQDGIIGEFTSMLDNRNLLKNVKSLNLSEVENPEQPFKIPKDDLLSAEVEIAEDYDIPRDYVILSMPEYPSFDEARTQVSTGDAIVKLSEISSIVNALNDAKFNYAELCIYVPKEYREKMSNFDFYDYLDLPEQKNTYNKQLRLQIKYD